MAKDNYFKVADLNIEYPIFLKINGRNWNFFREYEKKLKELEKNKDPNHKLFDLARDLDLFKGIEMYENIPFLVTSDIRCDKDNRRYYIVDYLIPKLNTVIILVSDKNKNKIRKMKDTLANLGLNVMEVNNLENKTRIGEYLKSLSLSLKFMTEDEMKYPKYFE